MVAKRVSIPFENAESVPGLYYDGREMNDDRAEWAQIALNKFAEHTGMRGGINHEDDYTVLKDLLGDLMHWAHKNKVDFRTALHSAAVAFIEESHPNYRGKL
jgi:hypothetical protein